MDGAVTVTVPTGADRLLDFSLRTPSSLEYGQTPTPPAKGDDPIRRLHLEHS